MKKRVHSEEEKAALKTGIGLGILIGLIMMLTPTIMLIGIIRRLL